MTASVEHYDDVVSAFPDSEALTVLTVTGAGREQVAAQLGVDLSTPVEDGWAGDETTTGLGAAGGPRWGAGRGADRLRRPFDRRPVRALGVRGGSRDPRQHPGPLPLLESGFFAGPALRYPEPQARTVGEDRAGDHDDVRSEDEDDSPEASYRPHML
ncbi:MAG TPA: hypothetical protein VH085_06280, partial [Nocardioides sp.]|nr:hypothetical protein [Nocardioides sp.]